MSDTPRIRLLTTPSKHVVNAIVSQAVFSTSQEVTLKVKEVHLAYVTLSHVASVYLLGKLGLGFVALLRARKEDVPDVVKALGHWWRRRSGSQS